MIFTSPLWTYLISVWSQNIDSSLNHGRIRYNDETWPSSINVSGRTHLQTVGEHLNDEQRLFRFILGDYDRSVRPVYNASSVVNVYMGLTLTHIFNINERSQVMTLNIWIEQYWHDERIRWNPVHFGNVTKMSITTRKMWTPDIVLYNNARDFSRGFMEVNLHVTNDGDIQYAPPAKVYSICRLDVSFFPFDDQFCLLEFRSWIYDISQLDLKIMERYDGKAPFTKDSFTENGEWEIVSNRTRRYMSGEGGRYSVVVFELHLRRRVLYFMYNIISPCVMLSILTMTQFILPCESGEKVTLGLTVLLAYSVFSFNIAESMPETSDVIPLIGIYLMCIMAISSLSVIFSVMVLNVRHGAENGMKIPRWLRFIGFTVIGRVFGSKHKAEMKQKRSYSIARAVEVQKINGESSDNESSDSESEEDIEEEENKVFRGLMNRVHLDDSSDRLVAQWSRLSNIFDRFFFFCILTLTTITTVGLLILSPRFSYRSFNDDFVVHKSSR